MSVLIIEVGEGGENEVIWPEDGFYAEVVEFGDVVFEKRNHFLLDKVQSSFVDLSLIRYATSRWGENSGSESGAYIFAPH